MRAFEARIRGRSLKPASKPAPPDIPLTGSSIEDSIHHLSRGSELTQPGAFAAQFTVTLASVDAFFDFDRGFLHRSLCHRSRERLRCMGTALTVFVEPSGAVLSRPRPEFTFGSAPVEYGVGGVPAGAYAPV